MKRETSTSTSYPYRVTLFCSGNDTSNETYLNDAKAIARGIAKRGLTVVNGASSKGLMGVTAREAREWSGEVFGIGLKDYEPEIHQCFTDWEGYSTYEDRLRRLTELGDVFIALAGGLGTLHEILDVHINQLLGKEQRPMIIVEPLASVYRELCQNIKIDGLYWNRLPEYIYFAKDASNALVILDRILEQYRSNNYQNKTFYPALSATEIYSHIKQHKENYHVLYHGHEWVIYPEVYPPNRFRSSKKFSELLTEDRCKNKTVLDVGCGPGNQGILAALAGATSVTCVDINPNAVANAAENASRFALTNVKTLQGSVFEAVKGEQFDMILFNPPFHSDGVSESDSKLMHSVATNKFEVLDLFFSTVQNHLNPNGKIYMAFSNKDQASLLHLETLLTPFTSQLIHHGESGSVADIRLYEITLK